MARPEHALRERVQKRWTERGLLWWSNHPPPQAGFPDTQGILFPGWSWVVEFKAEKGTLSKDQVLWLQKLARVGTVALEVRGFAAAPKPWRAAFRLMQANGVFGQWRPIDREDWLEHIVSVYHAN